MANSLPNLVLIMTDQQRGDCLSIARRRRALHTPNLDALAHGGARFSNAFTECPICIPARHTLMTGMSPDRTGCVGWSPRQRIADPSSTLPELLRQSGYQTAMIGRGMHQFPGYKRYGFEIVRDNPTRDPYSRIREVPALSRAPQFQNYPHLRGHGLHPNGVTSRSWPFAEEFHQTNIAVNWALQFLDDRDREAPFFLSVGFVAPHPPLLPPSFFYDRCWNRLQSYGVESPSVGLWCDDAGDGLGQHIQSHHQVLEGARLHEMLAAYYASIEHVDNQLLLLLERLNAEGETYVLFTSDHGEMLGDHHLWRKSSPYQGAVSVPFLLNGPRIEPSQVLAAPVGLQDILPTFCELAQVEVPSHVTGRSVLPLLRGESGRPHLHGEHANANEVRGFHFLTDGNWKYIWFVDGHEQLFDLQSDPDEMLDHAPDAKHAATLTTWRARLIEQLRDRPEGFSDGQTLIANRPYRPAMPHALCEP